MFAPSVPEVMTEFNSTNSAIETWVISIYVLGFAVGPLFVAPLSELYGRRPVYLISNALFSIFTIACAVSSNMGMLVAFRFLAGCAGSTPITLGGATVGDVFPKENRGAAMAIMGIGPLLGPAIGPVVGGYLAEARGWRWIFWLQTIISGTTLVLGLVALRETYAVYILEQKTRRLRRETGNRELQSALHDGTSTREHFTRAIIRPGKMLLMSPIILLLSVYVALLFGYLYLFITTFPRVFTKQYGFTTGQTGLTYLGLGVGCFLGLGMLGKTSDAILRRLTAKNHGVSKPEFRLPPLFATSPLIAIAFFVYGWSSEEKVHWIVPIIGTTIFGMGMMPAFVSFHNQRPLFCSMNNGCTSDIDQYVSCGHLYSVRCICYRSHKSLAVCSRRCSAACGAVAL
jgi:multidrug resistance protein